MADHGRRKREAKLNMTKPRGTVSQMEKERPAMMSAAREAGLYGLRS
jgi:hypothetical protein